MTNRCLAANHESSAVKPLSVATKEEKHPRIVEDVRFFSL